MKSLHIHVDLDVAGAQTVIMNYMRYLSHDSDIDIVLLINGCPKGSAYEKECVEKGYNVIYTNYKPWTGSRLFRPIVNWFKCQYYLYREIKKINPDIIHSHGSILLPYVTFPGLLSGCDLRFHTLHSDPYAFNKGIALWARFAFNVAKLYPICVTEGQAMKAEKRYHISKYTIIHNGIDGRRFRGIDKLQVREELGISPTTKVIGCVGRFEKIKNHEFLVKLFAEYFKSNRDSLLLLVGDGGERYNLEKLVCELGIKEHVLFTGLRNDVERLYFAMDLFMLTSFFESSSIVTVEAQFAGVRCVISKSIPDNVIFTKKVNRIPLDAPLETWLTAMHGNIPCDDMVSSLDDFLIDGSIKELKDLYKRQSL